MNEVEPIHVDREPFKELYPFKSNFVDIDGYRMHYVDEGESDGTMLMVHGNPTWSFFYRNLITHFSKEYRTVVPDHIGYGMSDKPKDKSNYSLELHINRFEKFVEKLNLDNITLVIHDWGGAIGMGYAVRHPGKIKRIVILNTFAFFEALFSRGYKPPWLLMLSKIPIMAEIMMKGFNGFSISAIYLAIAHRERRTPQVKAGYTAPYDSYAHRTAVLKFVQDIPLTEEHPSYKPLHEIEQNLEQFKDRPIIIFWGGKDFVFNDIVLSAWRSIYPDAEVKLIEDAGHYVLEDAHERIIPWMEEFLANNPITE